MTEISEKEVRAVADVLLGRVNAPEQEIYRAARDGLEAAALARAEANAGGPVEKCDGQLCYYHGCQKIQGCVHSSTHPAPQPSGTVGVKPLANLIHDALAFAVWAAGEGLCPTDGPPAPEDFLYAYSAATGFENWDAIPHHGATTLSALTVGKPEQSGTVEEALHHLKIIEGEANRVTDPTTKNNLLYEIERIRSALTAGKPEQVPSRWKPIETAPKDGTYVLLSNEHGTWVGHYVERYTSGYRPKEPWRTMMMNHWHMKRYASTTPTHWMPLPTPPTAGGGDE